MNGDASEDQDGGRPRRCSPCAGAAAALVAGLAAFLIINPAGDTVSRNVDDALTFVTASLAAVACLAASRRGGTAGRFWLRLGLACLFWALGEGAWGTYEVLLGVEVPTPSLADIGYLGAIPLAAAAVLVHPAMAAGSGQRRTRFVLDGLIVASGTFFLAWAVVLKPIVSAGGSVLQTAVTLAYPLGDALILSLILIALAHAPQEGRPPLYLVLAGLLALAVADSGFAYLTEVRGYETGHLIDLGWVAGYLLLMLGAIRSIGETEVEPPEPAVASHRLLLVGYIPVVVSLVLGGYRLLTNPERDPVLWTAALVSLGLVLVRQFVALAENVALAHELESKVHRRTRQLAEREARFRSLVQHSSDLILVLDPACSMRYASESVESILGWLPGEVIDQPLAHLVHREDADKVRAAVRTIVADPRGTTIVVDWRARRRDGSWAHLEGLLSNHLGEDAVWGLVLNSRDVTQRRQLEKSLRASEERLAAQVEELQELDRIKSDFVATASHELRTPLTNILGQLELMADGDLGPLTPQEASSVEVMERNGRRLLRLIEDLLTLARIESNGLKLAPAECDLRGLLKGVQQSLPASGPDHPRIRFQAKAGLGSAVVDQAQLERALLNLLTNAIKFTPPGGTVTCRAERSNGSVVFTVSDSGIGIPREEQERLFTRFYRSSLATKLAIQGSGLGLVITKTIVEAHGGTLTLVSTEGEGTTVSMLIPAPRVPRRDASRAAGG